MEGKGGEEKHNEVKGMKMKREKLEKIFLGRRKGEGKRRGGGGNSCCVLVMRE